MNDNESYLTLNQKLDYVTEELMVMRNSILNIEDNTEIKIMNGGNFEVTMKTNELLKHLYEQTKQGGIIDKKFEACKENHSTQKKMGIFDKKSAVWFNVIYRVSLGILIIYMFIHQLNIDKLLSQGINAVK